MTMIDPATGWFEIAPVIHPDSNTAQRILDSYWIAHYPRPMECGFDNGSEFKSLFLDGLATETPSPSTSENSRLSKKHHRVVVEEKVVIVTKPWVS